MMPAHKIKKDSGFVALMTAIALSIILITITVALNQNGFLTRSEILDAEYKDTSSALAEACADTALLKLTADPSYPGNEPAIAVGADTCAIGSVVLSGGQITIHTSAVFPSAAVTSQGVVTKLQIVVNATDLSVVSWDEIP